MGCEQSKTKNKKRNDDDSSSSDSGSGSSYDSSSDDESVVPPPRRQAPARRSGAASFQVSLGNHWKDYDPKEDKILKRAFMAGFPNAKFHLRGQEYEYNFKSMKQKNLHSRKEHSIRAPPHMKQPKKPIVPPGPTMSITVPKGSAGKTIQVPHPRMKGQNFSVIVPKNAKAGQAMLVPVPPVGPKPGGHGGVAGGVAAVAGIGGIVVAGALLGSSIADVGVDGTLDALGDAAGDAADAAGDFADVAGDHLADAADAAGDFADAAGDHLDPLVDEAGDHLADFADDAGDFALDAGDQAGDFIMDLF